jgi:predicted amidohydrolase YtcJ
VSADADLIVAGARVRNAAPGDPRPLDIAVRAGRIVALGAPGAISGLVGPATERLEVRGAVVVPGLVDAHCHPLWGARAMRDADLTEARSLDDALGRLVAAAAGRAPDEWVVAHGLRREWFDGPPVGAALDAAAAGRPMFVSFVDGHGAVANTTALLRSGVTGPREFADASQIVCDADGVPTGELREPSAMETVRTAIPPLDMARRRSLYRARLDRMASLGLTGAHVMDDVPGDFDDLDALEADDELPVRLVMHIWLQPDMDTDAIDDAIARASRRGRRWRAGAVKFFLDGVVDQGTAWMGASDPAGRNGEPNWPDLAWFAEVVRRCVAEGLGCATHAIGDRAIRTALETYAAAAVGRQIRRPCRIEHVEFCDPSDIARLAGMGVIASLQPVHVASVAGDPASAWGDRLDAVRRGWGWSTGNLIAAGAPVAFGSDWPVADQDPRIGMMWARCRRPPGGQAPGYRDDQAVDGVAALAGYTIGAARAVGDEGGCIALGAPADLTVLGADPVPCTPEELPEIPVRATVVGGSIAFRGPDV